MEFPAYKKVRVADLIPYARNSRTHSEAQVAQIAASIREFGFLNPVILDGGAGILAGHGRVLAARLLGLDVLPAIEAAQLTEAQRRAYVITDNKLGLNAGWDIELLKVEIADLKAAEFDLGLLGFSDFQMDAFAAADEVDFAADADETAPGTDGLLLTFGRRRVPMQQEEAEALEALFAEYSEGFGTTYGFVGWFVGVLDLNADITGLRGADYNPRHITPEDLDTLAESIATLGLVKPLIVRKDLLVAGHQRTKALRKLGIDRAAVFRLGRDTTVYDEIRFNQLHNGTDLDGGDENVRIAGGFDDPGFQRGAPGPHHRQSPVQARQRAH